MKIKTERENVQTAQRLIKKTLRSLELLRGNRDPSFSQLLAVVAEFTHCASAYATALERQLAMLELEKEVAQNLKGISPAPSKAIRARRAPRPR